MTTALHTAHPAATLAHDQLHALGVADGDVELVVDWSGPVALPLACEVLVQAACGIMAVHGRARGEPTPLAVDYATTVAGVLAAQGVLAAEFARRRGSPVRAVRTSVAQAALLSVGQYIACGSAELPTDPGTPPPFTSADGVRFEVETLRAEDWQRFWRTAGASEEALRQGWVPFLHRFATAVCPLPDTLHDTLSRLSMSDILAASGESGVSIVPLTTHAPVPPWTFTPLPGRRPVPVSDADLAAPLRGVLVVESTRRVQGPLAGHVLSLLGAEMLRIEPPGGDPARGVPPFAGSVSARFAALNAGKRVVELDLTTTAGRTAAKELVADADVFLHNWAPGRAEAWELDADDLAAVRPGLVYAAASGWGPHLGPHPPIGTDYVVQAHSGLAAALSLPGEPPAPSLMTVTDVLGGLVCAQGVLAALLRRTGTRVDTSLLSAAGVVPRHRREFSPLMRTVDGMVAAAGTVPPGVAADELTVDALLDRLQAHDVPAVAVTTDLGALAADPRFAYAPHRPPWEFT